jgi:hypothetical protein
MSAREARVDARMQSAIEELQQLLLHSYPDAQFQVGPSPEDSDIVHLYAIVDTDDLDAVLDPVIDRMMEIQIEDGLPLFVVTMRPAAAPTGGARPQARPNTGAALIRES